MTQYVYVRPKAGGRVRMPERNFTPMDAKGATVPRIDYYERLIIGGDLEITDPPAEASAPAREEQPAPPPPGKDPTQQLDPPRAPRSTKEK